jgi:tripartite-type tricarboxylate transporter receptor subunit TctC
MPELPSIGEFVPDYELSTWYGIGAPRGTPAEIIDTLNRETNAGLVDPRLKQRFIDLGDVPMPMMPAEFGAFMAGEIEKLTKVVKFADIKAD